MRLLLHFIKKDIYIQRSYRFDNILRITGIILQVMLFFFIGKLIARNPAGHLAVSRGDYFLFVLVGLAFSPIFSFGLSFCSSWIREETAYGTIEKIFSFPVHPYKILIAAGAGKCLLSVMECAGICMLGFFFFRIQFSIPKIFFLSALMSISIMVFFSLGVIAGSYILVFKRGDPVQWVLINISDILGGVYFPVSLLPPWMQGVSLLLPTTHILNAGRLVLLSGRYKEAGILMLGTLGAGLCLMVISLAVFKTALTAAKRKGSLGHF